MCNLLGIYSPEKLDPKLLEMVAAIQVYGSRDHGDGFGYFTSAGVFNKTWLAAESSAYPKELLSLDCEWVFTHIRKTSTGRTPPPKNDAPKEEWDTWRAKKQSHAHPFVFSDVAVSHNGTLNKKNGHDYEMDSMFFTEQFQLAYAETKDVDKALERALEFFDGGLASLLFSVRDGDVFIPYIMRGNKPLHMYIEERTQTTFVITEKSYFEPFMTVYKQLFDYKFTIVGLLEEGLYSPYSTNPILKKKYIEQKAAVTTAPYSTEKWRGKGTQYAYTPATKTSVLDTSATPLFSEFVKEVGKGDLARLTERIVNEFSDEDISKLLDLPEKTVVDILTDMQKGATVIL